MRVDVIPGRGMRTITDDGGVAWTVTEAYRFAGEPWPLTEGGDAVTLAVVWFETESGRTASVHLPAGSLETLDDEDLTEFLRVAVARRGRQP
jgi:hypothetical protein